ncbi:MAG: N-acetylmuramidase family protein [Desulfovibrio sp.]|jgi:hypothetical protein|nr:N-acetylmuramidase family protein [Desulfovibrio sp.]
MALSSSDIRAAAARIGVDPCAVKAVLSVESSGSGFLPDGRPKILFEGHQFWRELQTRGLDPVPLAKNFPNLVYPRWDKKQYRGGAAEWERLNAAARINRKAALRSASFGLFQIMGFNYAACGFDSVEAFVAAQERGEAEQLESFCALLKSQGQVRFLAARDFAGFAARYNGPGYAANQYDVRLRRAYERCKGGA